MSPHTHGKAAQQRRKCSSRRAACSRACCDAGAHCLALPAGQCSGSAPAAHSVRAAVGGNDIIEPSEEAPQCRRSRSCNLSGGNAYRTKQDRQYEMAPRCEAPQGAVSRGPWITLHAARRLWHAKIPSEMPYAPTPPRRLSLTPGPARAAEVLLLPADLDTTGPCLSSPSSPSSRPGAARLDALPALRPVSFSTQPRLALTGRAILFLRLPPTPPQQRSLPTPHRTAAARAHARTDALPAALALP
ncbi:hypothetical protein PSPO01_00917 [Paraphaeosphaeria sporulosa]